MKGPATIPTLLELAQTDTRLHRVSREYHGPCPMPGCTCDHDGFRVMPEKNRWACRGCCPGGDSLIGYVMKRDNIGYIAACRRLQIPPCEKPKLQGSSPGESPAREPSPEWQAAAATAIEQAGNNLWGVARHRRRLEGGRLMTFCRQKPIHGSAEALAFLHKRGIKEETARSWRLGYGPGHWWHEGLWVHKPSILIPWHVNGALWQVKMRQLEPIKLPNGDEIRYLPLSWCEKPRRETEPAGQPHLFGADKLGVAGTAIMAEGELDAILLDQEVGDLVPAITLGSCSASIPARAAQYLLPLRRILVAYDTDQPGRDGARSLVARYPGLPLEPVEVPISPPHGKDIGDFLVAGGSIRDWIRYLLMGGS